MKLILLAALVGFLMSDMAYGQVAVGRSRSDKWTETSAGNGRSARRQLAITSTDQKSELIVAFYPDLGGLGMTVSFFDKPARPCKRATLEKIGNTSLQLDGRSLPGASADSFTAGCREERWIERSVLGSVDAELAIAEAFSGSDEGVVRISSADGAFDHSYSRRDFRKLERGGLSAFRRSKGYQAAKSLER